MKVLVDASVWSLALRKSHSVDSDVLSEFKELIKELRVVMIGPIRQEILSGISDIQKFNLLKDNLSLFDDLSLDTQCFELAAQLSNTCRIHGSQGSHTDFLICAVSIMNNYPIFTLDKDFENYKKHIDIHLYKKRK
ncbi:MAG: PIN domain-containing protein [Spirochaetaceae bacterium]|nr:MAG: PIN domain-containing protein [Spirochaetaceae bacterium]